MSNEEEEEEEELPCLREKDTIAADLVTLTSLGTINPYWRADVLFSAWMEED